MAFKFLILAAACVFLKEVQGHGMMLDPAGRSSVWRFDKNYPPNYDDNQNFCKGVLIDWTKPGAAAKCGVCGDPAGTPVPQENQNTGKYGKGKVMRTYKSGQVVDVSVTLTTNHKGTFEYSLCVLPNPTALDTDSCFKDLLFEDGSKKYIVPGGVRDIKNRIRLPAGLKCERCVLRWHYIGAQHWGVCPDGSTAQGCGPQETYRSCADITIV